MKKYKAEVTYTVIYEIDPKSYSKGSTPEECLKKDLAAFEDDPEALFLIEDLRGSKETLKGRIISVAEE